jgi:hypothetical protein
MLALQDDQGPSDPFPLGQNSDSSGVQCMIALFQHKMTWGNQTCQSLQRLRPPKTSRFPSSGVNYTSCLMLWKGG